MNTPSLYEVLHSLRKSLEKLTAYRDQQEQKYDTLRLPTPDEMREHILDMALVYSAIKQTEGAIGTLVTLTKTALVIATPKPSVDDVAKELAAMAIVDGNRPVHPYGTNKRGVPFEWPVSWVLVPEGEIIQAMMPAHGEIRAGVRAPLLPHAGRITVGFAKQVKP